MTVRSMSGKSAWPARVVWAAVVCVSLAPSTWADTFGAGANQFSIDFVLISGDTNPTPQQADEGDLDGFGIVQNDYRLATCEITNSQWAKFEAELGVPVTGDPSAAYTQDAYWTGPDLPTTGVSWYEALQFVNWLNTSSGHHMDMAPRVGGHRGPKGRNRSGGETTVSPVITQRGARCAKGRTLWGERLGQARLRWRVGLHRCPLGGALLVDANAVAAGLLRLVHRLIAGADQLGGTVIGVYAVECRHAEADRDVQRRRVLHHDGVGVDVPA